MNYFDGATTVMLNAPLLAEEPSHPVLSSRKVDAGHRGRVLIWLIALIAVVMLAAAPWLETRAAYWKQTERNKFIAETVAKSLIQARSIASRESIGTRWSQYALGRDDSPRLYGHAWHISVGDVTTLGLGVINSGMDIELYCPGAEITFNPEGRPAGGHRQITIASPHDSEVFLIDVAADGSVTMHGDKAATVPPRAAQDISQAKL